MKYSTDSALKPFCVDLLAREPEVIRPLCTQSSTSTFPIASSVKPAFNQASIELIVTRFGPLLLIS